MSSVRAMVKHHDRQNQVEMNYMRIARLPKAENVHLEPIQENRVSFSVSNCPDSIKRLSIHWLIIQSSLVTISYYKVHRWYRVDFPYPYSGLELIS